MTLRNFSRSSQPSIDVAVLSRDHGPLPQTVNDCIAKQSGVDVRIHRIVGTANTNDPHRIATIARARNEAVRRCHLPWLMFVDDDVAIAPDCIARLHHVLASRPEWAAAAADYRGEASRSGSSRHVTMGATLFRRSVLVRTPFRWQPGACECLCCCQDVRRSGGRIEYVRNAKAWHLARSIASATCQKDLADVEGLSRSIDPSVVDRATILVAFNRRDVRRFRDVFLRSLRSSGNWQVVVIVGYGLYPSEARLLSQLPRVRVITKPVNGRMPPVRRLVDFGEVTSRLDPMTPVAYWDAGDVIIQNRLDRLWDLTQRSAGKILAVREPLGFPHNRAIEGWTRTIRHPAMRRRAFELFASRPFLNSGFAAGTAASMADYFAEAARLRDSHHLRGTTDWGDQSALNLYCHTDPERWQEIDEGWNYCVHDRARDEVHVTPEGRVISRRGGPIHVVHGNARSLKKLAIVRTK